MSPPREAIRKQPTGFSLIEIIAAMVFVATMALTTVPVLHRFQQQRTQAEQRQHAWQLLTNAMERLATEAEWDKLDEAFVTGIQQEITSTEEFLKNPAWRSTVEKSSDSPPSIKVTMAIGWDTTSDIKAAPIRLTRWFYQTEAP